MIILIWTLASICFALMCGCFSLMGKNTALEIEVDELKSELDFERKKDLERQKPFIKTTSFRINGVEQIKSKETTPTPPHICLL